MSAPAPNQLMTALHVASITVGENVRADLGDLTELAESIASVGVLQPIEVQKVGGQYEVVFGHRRLAAAKLAGLTQVPVRIRPAESLEGAARITVQLIENLQRADLNPIDESKALRAILDADPALTQAELAKRLGKSAPAISNRLRLLTLDEGVQAAVASGSLSASHAVAIAALPAKQQRDMAKAVVDEKLSAHALEGRLKWKTDEAAVDEAKAKRTEKWIPKAIAAIRKYELAERAEIRIHGNSWQVNVDAIAKAVKKAGWRPVEEYRASYGEEGNEYHGLPDGCTCMAFALEVGGRGAKVVRECIDRTHRDRQVNAEHERVEQLGRTVDAAVIESLRGLPLPNLRAIAWLIARASGWYVQWPDFAGATADELVGLAMKNGGAAKSMNTDQVEALVAELAGAAAEESAA